MAIAIILKVFQCRKVLAALDVVKVMEQLFSGTSPLAEGSYGRAISLSGATGRNQKSIIR